MKNPVKIGTIRVSANKKTSRTHIFKTNIPETQFEVSDSRQNKVYSMILDQEHAGRKRSATKYQKDGRNSICL